jgi:hypothetical protein
MAILWPFFAYGHYSFHYTPEPGFRTRARRFHVRINAHSQILG